jgi:hypothetical protein
MMLVQQRASASNISVVSGSTLTLSVYYDASGNPAVLQFVDTEGIAGLLVDGSGVVVFDSGSTTSMFPDSLLFALNYPDETEAAYIPLNPLTLQISSDFSQASILGPAAPFGTLTDPGLLALVNNGPLDLDFTFDHQIVDVATATVVNVYDLQSISQIPEPASMALLGSGLLAVFWRKRRS